MTLTKSREPLKTLSKPWQSQLLLQLLRREFDAAMRIYLNRFLNIPPATIPKKSIYDKDINPDTILGGLTELLDKQQRVNETGQLVADYLYHGGRIDQLTSMLGKLLLREDRNFHSIQMIEAAYRQYSLLDNEDNNSTRVNILLAASRYLRVGHYLCLHF